MASAPSSREGGLLSVVATPIGNLEDITLRALKVLAACDLVLAEDTRHTRALLTAHGIERPIERLDDHVVEARAERILDRLRAGEHIALVSDAGTPIVSDPGAPLVKLALEQHLAVEALPGASAVHVALVLSGLSSGGYRFVGFLPRDGMDRRRALLALSTDPLATVLFESPERAHGTLVDLAEVCGPARRVSVHRELTKRYEESLRGSVAELITRTAEGLRGEVTMVVEGLRAPVADEGVDAVDQALDAAIGAGMKPSDAAREVARALGLKRADVYARALARNHRNP